MTSQVDLVIIGAGAAGLSAAKHLQQSGLHICVLEARNRVGGRIHSLQNERWDYPIELGAEFVHGLSEDVWSIIRQSKTMAYEVTDEHLVLRGKKLRNSPDFWEELSDTLKKVDRFRRPRKSDLNLQTLLKQVPNKTVPLEKKQDLLGFVEGFHAADPSLVSVQAIMHEEEEADENSGSKSFRLLSRYDRLLKSIADDLGDAVLLNSAAKKIEWADRQVVVHTEKQTIKARAALITLPTGVLKSQNIFAPALEEKSHALSLIEMGSVIKIVMQFGKEIIVQKPFKDFAFIHSDDLHFPTWWSSRPIKLPILTGWSGGKRAQKLSKLGNEEIIHLAILSLSRVFGIPTKTIKKELVSAHVHNWQTDPFSRGAYSYIKEGGLGIQRELAQPLKNTLFFAGESTQYQDGQIGTVDGAIASGRRAAKEIIATFRNQKR